MRRGGSGDGQGALPFPAPPAPLDLAELRADAEGEGYRFIERLQREWIDRRTLFDGPGEALLVATIEGGVVGVGGLTADPAIAGALRLRRFYVRPAYRRSGVGRNLVRRLLEHAVGFTRLVTVNAGTTEAAAFWERTGFVRSTRNGITHERTI